MSKSTDYYRDHPEKRKEHNDKYRLKHIDDIRKRNRDYYHNHREEMLSKMAIRRKSNPELTKVTNDRSGRKMRDKIRSSVFDLIGWKCSKCGFDDWRALQIDHINGGGNEHRRSIGSSTQLHRFVLSVGGAGFQILCANCNQIKRHEQGEFRSSARSANV